MRNINIDQTHSRAIAREIGERLRGLLREETELPSSLKRRMQKLRELDERRPLFPAETSGSRNQHATARTDQLKWE
ncbi:hypothetical protein [Bradyrhizobium zhanjiangense]|uniref:hypothetical protein n=1 Tax=Bradyrhizobium zhanjiangense TaxID=1325107 RepID=UPI001008EA5A|nr:hypothetical protein [Bradyrhizobium zhanjiangense]